MRLISSNSFSLTCLSTLVSSLLLASGVGLATNANPYEDEAKRALEQTLPIREKDETSREYLDALKRAQEEDKPFLVWVGGVCLPCIKSMPWAIHLALDSFERDPSQRVVLGVRDARGVIRRVKTWANHFPSKEEVEEALQGPPQAKRSPPPSAPYCPPSG